MCYFEKYGSRIAHRRGVPTMRRLLFLKLLSILTCFVTGGLLTGGAMAGMNMKKSPGGELYQEQAEKRVVDKMNRLSEKFGVFVDEEGRIISDKKDGGM